MASPRTYQHWLPQAYLRNFTARPETLVAFGYDPDLVPQPAIFLAKPPSLCDVPPKHPMLEWHVRPIAELGGCYGLHLDAIADTFFDDETSGPYARAMAILLERAAGLSPGKELCLGDLALPEPEAKSLFLLPSLHMFRGVGRLPASLAGYLLWMLDGLCPLNSSLVAEIREAYPSLERSVERLHESRAILLANGLTKAEADEGASLLALWISAFVQKPLDLLAPKSAHPRLGHGKTSDERLLELLAREPDLGGLYVVRQPEGLPVFTTEVPFMAARGVGGEQAAVVPLGGGLWLVSDEARLSGETEWETYSRRFPAITMAQWLLAPEPLPEGLVLEHLSLYRGGSPVRRSTFAARGRRTATGNGRRRQSLRPQGRGRRYWARMTEATYTRRTADAASDLDSIRRNHG